MSPLLDGNAFPLCVGSMGLLRCLTESPALEPSPCLTLYQTFKGLVLKSLLHENSHAPFEHFLVLKLYRN